MNVAIVVALFLLLKIISFVNPERIDSRDVKFWSIVGLGVFASMFEILFLMMWLCDDIVISGYLYGVLIFGFVCSIGMFVAPFVEEYDDGKSAVFTLSSFLAICLTIVYFPINNYLIYYRNKSIDFAWIVSSIMIIGMLIIIIMIIISIIMSFKEDQETEKKKG